MKVILQWFFTFCFRSKIVVRKINFAAHKDSFLEHLASIFIFFRKLHAHVIDSKTEEMNTIGTDGTCPHLTSLLFLKDKNSIQNYLINKFIFISSSSSMQPNTFLPLLHLSLLSYAQLWKLGRIICLSASYQDHYTKTRTY